MNPYPGHDELSPRGRALAECLPELLKAHSLAPGLAYADAGGGRRCLDTVSQLGIPIARYGPGHELRVMNDVLKETKVAMPIICFRFSEVAAGALYHVRDMELHTDIQDDRYKEKVAAANENAYSNGYVLEVVKGHWRQVHRFPLTCR